MANPEACQVYIEQELKRALDEGKTPTEAAKEVLVPIQKMFEAFIPFETLRSRARHMVKKSGEITGNPVTTQNNSENPEKQEYQDVNPKSELAGPGRKPKYQKPPEAWTCAMDMAGLAIGQLSRIPQDDPKRREAFKKVIAWIEEQEA